MCDRVEFELVRGERAKEVRAQSGVTSLCQCKMRERERERVQLQAYTANSMSMRERRKRSRCRCRDRVRTGRRADLVVDELCAITSASQPHEKRANALLSSSRESGLSPTLSKAKKDDGI